MKTVILGAGSSRGSFPEDFIVPTSNEFGKVLQGIDNCWKDRYPAILKVVDHLGLDAANWPLERVWTCIDLYAKLDPALPKYQPWNGESPQLKKALLSVYGKRCDSAAEKVSEESTLAKVLATLEPQDCLISFNYDTIAERVAMCHSVSLFSRPKGGAGVVLAKPHGSASWTLDLRSKTVTAQKPDGTPLLTCLTNADVDCQREPLVLGAVPIKSELIKQVQQCGQTLGVYSEVITQWRTVVEAIRDSSKLIVLGYSFPPEDIYGRFMFSEGRRLRLRTHDLSIEYYELEECSDKIANSIVETFEVAQQNVKYLGPVRPRSA